MQRFRNYDLLGKKRGGAMSFLSSVLEGAIYIPAMKRVNAERVTAETACIQEADR